MGKVLLQEKPFRNTEHGTGKRMAKDVTPTKPNNLVQTIERVAQLLEMIGRNPKA